MNVLWVVLGLKMPSSRCIHGRGFVIVSKIDKHVQKPEGLVRIAYTVYEVNWLIAGYNAVRRAPSPHEIGRKVPT
jgi:hypothetical protein